MTLTEEKIRKIIVEQLGVDEDDVIPGASIDDLGGDSLDLVELVMAVEHEFNLEIPDEDGEGLLTVQEAVSYVERRLGVFMPAPVSMPERTGPVRAFRIR